MGLDSNRSCDDWEKKYRDLLIAWNNKENAWKKEQNAWKKEQNAWNNKQNAWNEKYSRLKKDYVYRFSEEFQSNGKLFSKLILPTVTQRHTTSETLLSYKTWANT